MNTEEIDYNSRENKIAVFTACLDGKVTEYSAHNGAWIPHSSLSDCLDSISDDRYMVRVKPTPKRVPLEAKDVPPGSAFRCRSWREGEFVTPSVAWSGICAWINGNMILASFKELMKDGKEGWDILRPCSEWKECSKEVSE